MAKNTPFTTTYLIAVLFFFSACQPEPEEPVLFDGTPYILEHGILPDPNLPADNSLTEAGVTLGKMLFYDKKLSRDNIQSCATCHDQSIGFSDSTRFSLGVAELPGTRQAMSIVNMAWNTNGFFWDGRAELLRHQAVLPIEDELEMDESIENVLAKLAAEKEYRDQFTRAFGDEDITEERLALALEQFMFSIISYQSKYDRYLAGEATLTDSEERGRELYFSEFNPFFPEESGADCEHCHGGFNFENDMYMNNGLDADGNIIDAGRFLVSNSPADIGKFKVPSLRNIGVTQPYMHDGRFKTLEEVIDHYDHGIVMSSTLDPALIQVVEPGLGLSEQDKEDLINFLHTLTDETYLANPLYADPF